MILKGLQDGCCARGMSTTPDIAKVGLTFLSGYWKRKESVEIET